MILAFTGLSLIAIGMIVYYITILYPKLCVIYLDWFALFIISLAWFVTLYKVIKSDAYRQIDTTPKNKHLIEYLRRDNKAISCYGERIYSGESFLEVPGLGLIEYLGKDCFYTKGDKKFVWTLENLNFTPDPKYGNFTSMLWRLGFNNSDDVTKVLQGKDLELMGKIYINMVYWDKHNGVNRLLDDMESYSCKTIGFKPQIWDLIKQKKRGFFDDKKNS